MTERRKLSALQPGEGGTVVEISGSGDGVQRLMDMGLIRGTAVKVIRHAPLGDPLEVRVRGFMLTLRRSEAEHITVE